MADALLWMSALLLVLVTAFAYALTKMRDNAWRLMDRADRRLKDLEAAQTQVSSQATEVKEQLEGKASSEAARDKDLQIVADHAQTISVENR